MISKNIDLRHVKIEIVNEQTVTDSTETVREECDGKIVTKDGVKALYYTLNDEKCVLRIDGKTVRLVKTPSGSSLFFESGKECVSRYVTQYGDIEMTVKTEQITDNINQNGVVMLEYDLSAGNTEPIHNKMTIKIKEI